jgi:hypothetical protein
MNIIKKVYYKILRPVISRLDDETPLLALGVLLSNQQYDIKTDNPHDYEFKIFSQWGDDGIIQYLIKHISIANKTFIEFGVEDYHESNTRFLMMHNNWEGFIMDGSEENIERLQKKPYYWKYGLTSKSVFITAENINPLLEATSLTDIGLLSIDLDGNDLHILNELDLSRLNPSIIIMEYNSVFGKDRLITVPYDPTFMRTKKHYSNLYFGASLPALNYIANKKGYALIGSDSAGVNAYFVRDDLLNERIKKVTVEKAHVTSKARESRNKDGSLSYISGEQRYKVIQGLPVLNVITNEIENL